MKDFFWPKFVEVYKHAFSVLKKNPTVWFLFLAVSVVDLISLTLLFLSPSPPVSFVLAPVIERFWDDKYLHYPNNFLLLPELFRLAHFAILTVFGVFVTGIAVKKIEQDNARNENFSTVSAAREIVRLYISLVTAWLISYMLFSFLVKSLLSLCPTNFWMRVSLGFVISIGLQALLGYILPGIVIEKKFFKGAWTGVTFGFKHLVFSMGLIVLPMLVVAVSSFAKHFTPHLIRMNPEMVLVMLVFGIFISMASDLMVTMSTAVYYLKVRK